MATVLKPTKVGTIPQLKVGFYGAAGSGKTTLIAGFSEDPRTGPSLWIDCGGNPNIPLQEGKIGFALSLEVADDLLAPLSYMYGGQKKNHPFAKEFGPFDYRFKSIVIDTFSDWQGLLIDQITGIKSNNLRAYNIHSAPAPHPTKHGKDIAHQTLFTARQLLLAMPSDIHVFLTFQEYEAVNFSGDGDGAITGGMLKKQIAVWGQSRNRVPAWLNLMGAMEWQSGFKKELDKRGKERSVKTLYPVLKFVDDQAQGKNQVATSLGKGLRNPTAKQILDKIQNVKETN